MRSKMTLSALVTLGGFLGGCGEQTVLMREASRGAGGAGATCAGQCVPLGPYESGWTDPALLWMGNLSEAPECPKSAPIAENVGFADLDALNPCSACQCEQPTGTCAISSTLTAYTTYPTVPLPPGAVATSFNAPAGWSDACTTESAIPAGKQCNGTACVHSVTRRSVDAHRECVCAQAGSRAPQLRGELGHGRARVPRS